MVMPLNDNTVARLLAQALEACEEMIEEDHDITVLAAANLDDGEIVIELVVQHSVRVRTFKVTVEEVNVRKGQMNELELKHGLSLQMIAAHNVGGDGPAAKELLKADPYHCSTCGAAEGTDGCIAVQLDGSHQ